MDPNLPLHSEPAFREAIVALEGVIGARVRFDANDAPSPGPAPAQELDLRVENDEIIAPVWHGGRFYGTLHVAPEATSDVQAEGRVAATVRTASRPDIVALFARLLALIMSQARRLEHRVAELNAVYRVSAALTESKDIDDLLRTALKTVMEVVDVSAGSIRLLKVNGAAGEPSNQLVVRAAVNLSQEYFDRGPVIANDSELDMRALAGEMVYVEDLATDPRVRFPDLVEKENLHSFLCTGLVFNGRPIGVLRLYTKRKFRTFSEYEQGLVRVAAQQIAAAIVNRRLIDERREALQIRRQLELASSVQQRMLPQHAPTYPNLDIAARCIPSFELGGDFYDYLPIDANNIGLAIGDVVGKGVPAALLAASVKAGLRAHARYLYDLDEVMKRTNRDLVHDTRPNEFATLWYGVIDTRTRRLTFCNAGHEPPLVYRHNGESKPDTAFTSLFTGGMIIGYDEEFTFSRAFVDLRPGDVLLAFSDGLTDALNFDNERYELRRVKQTFLDLMRQAPESNAEAILNHLLWEVRRFFGFRKQSDDITLLVARVL